MSDSGLPTNRPKHARTTSITTSKKTMSHQRKPSFTLQQQQHHPHVKPYNNKSGPEPLLLSSDKISRPFNSLASRVRSFLNPAGPLLPHSKHSQAFGGTSKPSFLQSIARSRAARLFILFYVIFSVLLSLSHIWTYLTTIPYTVHKDLEWVPQRTYDQDETYSLMSQMTHGLKMHKLFSKSYYQTAKHIQPFWQKASTLVDKDQVTIITSVTPETWDDLKRLTIYWEGPVSVILHVQDETELDGIRQDYENTPGLKDNVDVHVAVVPGKQFNVLLPRNAERNLARLLATTDSVLDLPIGVIPATDLQKTLQNNKDHIQRLLKEGHLVAIPTFSFQSSHTPNLPSDKKQLVHEISEGTMFMDDKHWKENVGPTDLEKWIDANDVYAVEKYEFHYEPVVIESKKVQPWCSERFLDRRAACIFTSYLQGNDIWVLPDDFMIQLPHPYQEKEVSDFDNVVEDRMYAKFYWEQCVFFARQLDSLGLWKTAKSKHIRNQCSRVIQNWGKGLIGKPE